MSETTLSDAEVDALAGDEVGEVTETETTTVAFYNQHEGTHGRLAGKYLDEEERKQAEIDRAASEGREPQLESSPAGAGTPLVLEAQLPDNSLAVSAADANALPEVTPAAELPVDLSAEVTDVDTTQQEQEATENGNYGNPPVI